MNVVSLIMVCFSMIAAVDRIIGNKLGLGKEFEKGFMLLGTMMLSMTGMIIISPLIADIIEPVLDAVYKYFGIDPSIIPASLFANDMGGAPLANEVAKNDSIGKFNALVVSSMLGCTISFTIPFSLGMVKKEQHNELLLGLLCGIVTIPVGCFVAGLMLNIPIASLAVNMIIPVILSAIICCGLVFFPKASIKIFAIFGVFMRIIITSGLALGVFQFVTKLDLMQLLYERTGILLRLDTLESGTRVCLNAAAVMSGAFPLMSVVSRLLRKPLKIFGNRIGVNEHSAMGFISSLATSVTTFELMERMDKKGVVLNSAFAVSAAFTFAGHLAFTLAYDASYLAGMVVAKLLNGVLALVLAVVIYKRFHKS